MIRTVTSNWNFMRLLRLVAGIAITTQAIMARDVLFALAGLAFTGMALFNIGCCGVNGCSAPVRNESKTSVKDISYEEVV